MSDYYPIMLNVRDQRCVVIGGGEVAERKVIAFLECGAAVCVISPNISPELRRLCDDRQIQVINRDYRTGDLSNALVAIAATDDPNVNASVFSEGKEKGILTNVVDDPEKSTFIVPSMLRRGDLLISISTSGRSPALARKIRTELEQQYGPEYALLAEIISEVRSEIKDGGIHVDSETWQKSMNIDKLLALLRKGDAKGAKEQLITALQRK